MWWTEFKTWAWPWLLALLFIGTVVYSHHLDAERWSTALAAQTRATQAQGAALDGIRELLARQGYISRPLVEQSR